MSNFCCLPGIAGGLPSFIYTLAQNPPGTLRGVQDFIASTGWTSVVPMILQPDAILTGLLSYNSATGRAVYSTGASPPGTQVIVQDFTASPGWTAVVPLNLNGDHLTDLLSYNKNTGRAVYSIGASPPGTQVIVKDTIAPKGWTSIVPMNLNGDGLTDLLFYNKTTGRTVYSVAAPL